MSDAQNLIAQIEQVYDYYNLVLFDSCLPTCAFRQVEQGANGFITPFFRSNDRTKYEIEIERSLYLLPLIEQHASIVHEMVHLKQEIEGDAPQNLQYRVKIYHNKNWAKQMESLGLMPSDKGAPGGKKIGNNVSQYAIDGGLFKRGFEAYVQRSLQPSEGQSSESEFYANSHEITYKCDCNTLLKGNKHLIAHCGKCHSNYRPS